MQATPDLQAIPMAEQQSFNQAQLQAQAVQFQREQYNRQKIQQAFANKIAVFSAIAQVTVLLSASALLLALTRYALIH